jgi:hypothetical protein
MRKLIRWPSPAMIVALIALFVALGGSVYAANKISGSTIKKSSLPGNRIKKNSVTGKQVKESTLGQVPSALSATSASEASAANGMHFAKINFAIGPNTPSTTVFSADGLTLSASCNATPDLNLTGTTSVDNSEIYESGNYTNVYKGGFDDNFDIGDTENVGQELGDESQNEIQGQLVYSTPAGAVVTIQFSINDFNFGHGGTQACNINGTAVYS